jgi:NAD(P)H-dependent FMN reductase
MLRIAIVIGSTAIVIGSTRPNRVGSAVAAWAHSLARPRDDAEFVLLDIADFDLPLLSLGEPKPSMSGEYTHQRTRAWAAAIASFDGYVFVTPEYNHGISAALKNAIDFLYQEWLDKAAGFIGYGYTMDARTVEHLRLVMASLQVATVRPQVGLSLFVDFEQNLGVMLDRVTAWSGALKPQRQVRR